MPEKISVWARLMSLVMVIVSFFSREKSLRRNRLGVEAKSAGEEEVVPEVKTWKKDELLQPIRHRRYITCYCITDLKFGGVPIYDRKGGLVAEISAYSLGRLTMEGTGRLPDGRVINVDKYVNGKWNYVVMTEKSPDGLGIRGAALVPWVSLAHHLQQLKCYGLFNRKVVIPSLLGHVDPDSGKVSDGVFRISDTGGGLRRSPYSKGLWRTGARKSEYGQFDLFVGSEKVYKELLGSWNSYREVIVLPRDTISVKGIQESCNLLSNAMLRVDGRNGPKTKSAIKNLQDKAGLEETGVWCEDTERYVVMSLDNWR